LWTFGGIPGLCSRLRPLEEVKDALSRAFLPQVLRKLEGVRAAGFRHPGPSELPPECELVADTFLVNDKGGIKSVSQMNGSLRDWPYKTKPRSAP
jgi:hypothetical protein